MPNKVSLALRTTRTITTTTRVAAAAAARAESAVSLLFSVCVSVLWCVCMRGKTRILRSALYAGVQKQL